MLASSSGWSTGTVGVVRKRVIIAIRTISEVIVAPTTANAPYFAMVAKPSTSETEAATAFAQNA